MAQRRSKKVTKKKLDAKPRPVSRDTKKMKLQITFTDEFPEALKASAEKCLRDGITFLEGIPRPATPEIEYLTPDFENMKFQFGENVWSHGLFSTDTMAGWCVMDYRSNGELLINSTPCWTVLGVDPEIATTCSVVYVLDQYFVVNKNPEQHLLRQLQYLDSIAASNKAVRSLLDEYEQHLADQDQSAKDEWYSQQSEEKRYLQARKYAYDTALRIPLWFLERYQDSPQSLKGEFIVTQGGHPIGTHVEWRNGSLAPPPIPPNKAVANLHKPKESKPFVVSDAEDKEIEGWLALYDAAMGRVPAGSCQDHDK